MIMPRVVHDESQTIDPETGLNESLRQALDKAVEVASITIGAQAQDGQTRPFEIIQRRRENTGAVFTLTLRYSPPIKSTAPLSAIIFGYMEEIRRVLDNIPQGATFGQIESITNLPEKILCGLVVEMVGSGEIIRQTDGDTEVYKYATAREGK
jgi:hypothetical protein